MNVSSKNENVFGVSSIIKPTIEKGRRVLVTSDIHGHVEYLKNVLARANFSTDDVLIINGDLTEKGPASLECIRYVLELMRDHTVYYLSGNVDFWRVNAIKTLSKDNADRFIASVLNLRSWKGTSLFDEMARELNIPLNTAEDALAAKDVLLSAFSEEIALLENAPTILSCGSYIFVHGGLRSSVLSENIGIDAWSLLKYDSFLTNAPAFDRYVVVGHWPVTIYNEKIANADPVVCEEKRIISIDGGCGLKTDGQLNLYVIPDIYSDSAEYNYNVRYDTFPKIRALDAQNPSEKSLNILWGDTDIILLEKGEEFSLVEHASSGYRLRMYNEYIYGFEERTTCNDYTDAVLAVNSGDVLSLIHKTGRGCIVKNNGRTGWYYGKFEEIKEIL